MKCTQVRLLAHATLDAEVNADEKASVSEHLSECARCEAYAKVFGALKRRVSAIAAPAGSSAPGILERGIAACDRPGEMGTWASRLPFQRHRIPHLMLAAVIAVTAALGAPL